MNRPPPSPELQQQIPNLSRRSPGGFIPIPSTPLTHPAAPGPALRVWFLRESRKSRSSHPPPPPSQPSLSHLPGLLLTALTPASWVATLRSLDPRGLRPCSLLVSVSHHPALKLNLLRLPFI